MSTQKWPGPDSGALKEREREREPVCVRDLYLEPQSRGESERARGERKMKGEGGGGQSGIVLSFLPVSVPILPCDPARSQHNPACSSVFPKGRVCKISQCLPKRSCLQKISLLMGASIRARSWFAHNRVCQCPPRITLRVTTQHDVPRWDRGR